jgi:hypothetical protein
VSRAAALLLVALCGLAVACDKVALLAPSESTIILNSNSTTLPVNGTAELIATVTEQAGTPVHNGTVVTFTSSVGTIEPREARTEGGIARATFRAGSQSGTARISAFSGSARAEEVEILVGGAAAQNVSVRLEPPFVPQTGATVQVIATVTDVSGNRLPGAPVVFSADNGTVGSNSGLTDSLGEARTTLTTNRQTVVRASVGEREGQATVSVVNLPSASVTFTPAQPLVGLPVTFTITPSSGTNSNLIQSATLDFGDGKPPATMGSINGAQSVQHVYDRADSFTTTLTLVDSAGLRSVTSTIVTVARPVVGVSVTPSAPTGQVGTPLTFAVAVANNSNVAVQGVVVSFGDGTSTTLGPTGGTVPKVYTIAGGFTVRATATDQAGNRYEGTTSVIIQPASPIDVTLDATGGDNTLLSCTPLVGYPKQCTATLPIFGFPVEVRVVLTAGCGPSAAPCTNVLNYFWTYGDGTTETTSQRSVDHKYVRGTYEINLEVRTTTGATGFQRLRLIIQ